MTNTYVSPVTSITATKKWVGGPADKPTVTLVLNRNGEVYDEKELVSGQENVTWDQVPVTDNNGVPYTYTVSEKPVDNYTSNVEGFVVTNTYVSPVTSITATKKWVGGPADKPTVTLVLNRNGEVYDEKELVSGQENVTWDRLPVTDDRGVPFVYTISEKSVDNYTATVDDLVVTNTYVSPLTTVTATKKWVGGPAERPTIQLQLLQNGQAYGEKVTLPKGVTEYSWEVPATDNNGQAYVYTVDEEKVPENYVKEINGLTVTNFYRSPLIEVTGTIEWPGIASNVPTVRLQLKGNGQNVGEPITVTDGRKGYTWPNLPLTDETGNPIVYTIEQLDLPSGFTQQTDGLHIVNTFVDQSSRANSKDNQSSSEEKEDNHTGRAITPAGNVTIMDTDDGMHNPMNKKLPETGANHTNWSWMSGMFLLMTGVVVWYQKRKDTTSN